MSTTRQIIHEDKIVVDSHTKVRSAVAPAESTQAVVESDSPTPTDTRPVLVHVITRGAWEDPQKYIVKLIKYFKARYRVYVVFGTYEFTGINEFRQQVEALGVEVRTISTLQHTNVVGNEITSIIKFHKLFRELGPTVVHVHDAKTSLLVGIARMFGGNFRHIATVHQYLHTSGAKSYEVSMARAVFTWAFGMSEFLIMRNQFMYSQLHNNWPGKVSLVLPGLEDITFVNPRDKLRSVAKDAPPLTQQYLEDPDTLVIGSIAPLEADQGIAYTLQALQILKEQGLQFVYIHYGAGDQMNLLEHEVAQFGLSDHVLFKGRDARAQIYLQMFDVVVLSTTRNGDVGLLRDAGQAKRAVITTDISGVAEIIEDQVHAVVVAQKNPEALAQAITELAGDASRRATLGNALEARIKERYSQEVMLSHTEKIYEGNL